MVVTSLVVTGYQSSTNRPGFRDEQSPLVLLCGFGGSHLDDLQPAIDHWTLKGFGLLAFGPARLGREDMLDLKLGRCGTPFGYSWCYS